MRGRHPGFLFAFAADRDAPKVPGRDGGCQTAPRRRQQLGLVPPCDWQLLLLNTLLTPFS